MFKYMMAWVIKKVYGWKVESHVPDVKKCVIIAAPHTSNWDFLFFLMCMFTLGIETNWMGKHTMFRWPFRWLLKQTGGIAIVRHKNMNVVETMAAEFEKRDNLFLVIPAEGTRSYRDHWRSGFYRIAEKAGVPIACGYLDYAHKTGGIGIEVLPSGDVKADMAKIRAFYANKSGKHPENFSPVRLKEEE